MGVSVRQGLDCFWKILALACRRIRRVEGGKFHNLFFDREKVRMLRTLWSTLKK